METNKKKVICAKCGVEHTKSGTAFKKKGRYYCEECLPEDKVKIPTCPMCKEPLDMDTAEAREEKGKKVYYCARCISIRNREARAHYDLVDYIYQKHSYKEKGIGGDYIVTQIKLLKNTYPHYKETGMLASLKYYYEVLKKDIHPNPFKLIPYIYEDAKAFYEKKREITAEYERLMNEPVVEKKQVIVKSQPHKPKIKIKRIDLDSL